MNTGDGSTGFNIKSSSSKSVKEKKIASLTIQEFNIVPHIFLVKHRQELTRTLKRNTNKRVYLYEAHYKKGLLTYYVVGLSPLFIGKSGKHCHQTKN